MPFQGNLAGGQTKRPEPPFALPVLSRQVVVDGPPGPYRFVASFERGAAPAGGETTFHLGDRATLPAVTNEVVLWGEDTVLSQWLSAQRIPSRLFRAESQSAREIVLVGLRPPAPGAASAFRDLARHVARGSVAIFLCPEVFAHDKDATRWMPLVKKGALTGTSDWLYHKDEWAKPHPVFDGLPTGLLDYTYYRELIPHRVWTGLDAPDEAVAGANNTSYDYSSGLMLSVHRLGAGRVILNTFPLRERLGQTPAADRLAVNLLRFASRETAPPLAPLPSDFAALLRALRYE